MRELLKAEYLHDEILDTVAEIAAYPDVDTRKVISSIELVLNYDKDGLPQDVHPSSGLFATASLALRSAPG